MTGEWMLHLYSRATICNLMMIPGDSATYRCGPAQCEKTGANKVFSGLQV